MHFSRWYLALKVRKFSINSRRNNIFVIYLQKSKFSISERNIFIRYVYIFKIQNYQHISVGYLVICQRIYKQICPHSSINTTSYTWSSNCFCLWMVKSRINPETNLFTHEYAEGICEFMGLSLRQPKQQ